MTKQALIRATVLEAINNGASEAEAAAAAGVEQERVQRILDALEWERPEPPEEKEARKPVLPRSRTIKYEMQNKPAAPVKRKSRAQAPPPRYSSTLHGTTAGYNVYHTGVGRTPICEPCSQALKVRSAKRTHAKREKFPTAEAAYLYVEESGKPADVVLCQDCSYWHVVRRMVSAEEQNARKRATYHRRKQEKLDRLADHRVDFGDTPEQRMPMSTTRSEIREVLTANLWNILQEDPTFLVASWRNRKIAMRFDQHDRICGLVTERPAPFNGADIQTPILTHRKSEALKFIRGE